jgi:hypothetical protein
VIAAFFCANCIRALSTQARTDKGALFYRKIFAESWD